MTQVVKIATAGQWPLCLGFCWMYWEVSTLSAGVARLVGRGSKPKAAWGHPCHHSERAYLRYGEKYSQKHILDICDMNQQTMRFCFCFCLKQLSGDSIPCKRENADLYKVQGRGPTCSWRNISTGVYINKAYYIQKLWGSLPYLKPSEDKNAR